MSSLRVSDLRQHLTEYLDGDASLDDFKDWLVGATWDIDETGDAAAIELTYDIKLALAEHSGGHISENELRTELRPLAPMPSRARRAAVTT
jgi:hypothetical protein